MAVLSIATSLVTLALKFGAYFLTGSVSLLSDALEAFVSSVTASLKAGQDVRLVGFGTFLPVSRAAGMARNPRTGDPVEVAARPVPVFKPSKELRALVADEDAPESAEASGH